MSERKPWHDKASLDKLAEKQKETFHSSGKAPASHSGDMPWVRLKSAASGHQLYKRMVGDVDAKARAGDIVAVYDKTDASYGVAIYNPKSLITLRLLHRGRADFDLDAFFSDRIKKAVEFRRDVLQLDKVTDAYRLIHDQGDGFPGIVVDRYGDFIVLEFYTLGMFRQAERLERLFREHFPNAKFVHRASQYTQTMEGFKVKHGAERGYALGAVGKERDLSRGAPARTRIKENGVVFEVEPSGGYKTGFFCDQRENRMGVAALCAGKRVLDVCSYTGGFGLYAKKIGGAADVTCVELDEDAAALIQKNANINQVRVNSVCVDAFPYLRQAAQNQEKFGVVILDPYKIIASREGYGLGRKKYIDLNRLALGVVEEGGVLVTCSCSGMLPWEEFQQILRTAAGSAGRRVQIFRKSGASPDHPIAADHPEGEYLKAIWCRVL